jgi:hypothetical protein
MLSSDVVYPTKSWRPGMSVIAKLGTGQYMLTYELGGAPEDPSAAPYAVHYKIASNPLLFNSSTPIFLNATNGNSWFVPSSCPYPVWTPAGGVNGTIVLSEGRTGNLFINKANGLPGYWQEVTSHLKGGYTRALTVMPDNSTILVVNGGAWKATDSTVIAGQFIVT